MKVGKGEWEGGGSGGRNALKERWNLLDIFIQHSTSKRFLFIQKEILRCRIHLKIFDIFKRNIIFERDNFGRRSVESGTIYRRGI